MIGIIRDEISCRCNKGHKTTMMMKVAIISCQIRKSMQTVAYSADIIWPHYITSRYKAESVIAMSIMAPEFLLARGYNCCYTYIYEYLYLFINLTIIELTMWPCGNRLLKRRMPPSPKSQVMFASAFLWIGDYFRIFGIHSFYATGTLLNIWICMRTDAAECVQ